MLLSMMVSIMAEDGLQTCAIKAHLLKAHLRKAHLRKAMASQAPVHYTWRNATPRFVPLAETCHG